jgi:CheY-like chemotaxis protein
MKKILFIEDESDLNIVYKKKFSSLYEIDFAVDSETALTKVISWHPDLIILDIIIPGKINGIGLLKEIKNNINISYIPVLVLTNLEDEEKTVKSLGAVDCLIKSNVGFDVVAEKIENILTH